MKILLLSLYAPYPPYDGGSIRTFELLQALASKHSVTYLSTYNPQAISSEDLAKHLSPLCKKLVLVGTVGITHKWSYARLLYETVIYPPISLTKHLSPEYIKELNALLQQKYDVIICNSILSGQSLNWAESSANSETPKILDLVDIFDLMYSREYQAESSNRLYKLLKYLNWQKIRFYERSLWRKFTGLIAISDADLRTLQTIAPTQSNIMLPNGIRLAPQQRDEHKKAFDILIVGRLDYAPNIEAIRYFDQQILPILLRTQPNLKVALVGKNPQSSIQMIVERDNTHYALFSNVPDVSDYYRQSKVAVVPVVSGSGIKIKLLEALAQGCPVVTTSVGAYGVPVIDRRHVLIADTPQQFADSIFALTNNDNLSRMLAYNGQILMQEQYDWQKIKIAYLQFVEQFTLPPNQLIDVSGTA